ncbi:hypothetical protein LTR85_003031 [Meristemomyces frigidus]|nr:hypothetical protein LTR85_003031 [Meristemomyces frigidus]
MERVDVDSDGDIILAVANTLELRVSSRILTLTSPVFKAMLGPHFAEGQALRNATKETPKTISLPDDNAADMQLLCFVLHPTNINVPEAVSVGHVRAFAELVDKYGCAGAVKYTTSVWLSVLEEERDNLLVLQYPEELLPASYYLDNPRYFSRFTNILARRSEECKDDFLPKRDKRLPPGLVQEINKAMLNNEKELQQRLGDIVGSLVEAFAYCAAPEFRHEENNEPYYYSEEEQRCTHPVRIVHMYMEAFMEARLWPCRNRPQRLCRLLAQIDQLELPMDEASDLCATCAAVVAQLHRDFECLKEKATTAFAGVCLDCFRAGERLAGPCRFPHQQ